VEIARRVGYPETLGIEEILGLNGIKQYEFFRSMLEDITEKEPEVDGVKQGLKERTAEEHNFGSLCRALLYRVTKIREKYMTPYPNTDDYPILGNGSKDEIAMGQCKYFENFLQAELDKENNKAKKSGKHVASQPKSKNEWNKRIAYFEDKHHACREELRLLTEFFQDTTTRKRWTTYTEESIALARKERDAYDERRKIALEQVNKMK